MKKNVASQVIGAQMVSATDGSAFTGAVTIYVTGNAGTQAIGSVSSGACTHEGNGYHTYVPAQAETNYDHIGFTFIGSGAIPATLQVYPTFPQTGDSYGLVNGASGVVAIKSDTAAILADTGTDGVVVAAASKTGYSLTQSFPSNFASLAITGGGAVTAGTVSDKTGYSLTQAFPTNFSSLSINADGRVDLIKVAGTTQTAGDIVALVTTVDTVVDAILDDTGTSGVVVAAASRAGVRKNTALTAFGIVMTDSTTHAPATGKTVTVTRSIDGGAFGAGTLGAVTEIGSGAYEFDFGAGDLNGDIILLRATATACDDLLLMIKTSP